MKKKSSTNMEIFIKEFTYWQEKFDLSGYRVFFRERDLENAAACISIDLTQMTAVVTFNPDTDKKIIKQVAKHEAIHLLTGRLERNGATRYIGEYEMIETMEELVNKLERLIQ